MAFIRCGNEISPEYVAYSSDDYTEFAGKTFSYTGSLMCITCVLGTSGTIYGYRMFDENGNNVGAQTSSTPGYTLDFTNKTITIQSISATSHLRIIVKGTLTME